MNDQITEKILSDYEESLIQREYARGSIEKYLRISGPFCGGRGS